MGEGDLPERLKTLDHAEPADDGSQSSRAGFHVNNPRPVPPLNATAFPNYQTKHWAGIGVENFRTGPNRRVKGVGVVSPGRSSRCRFVTHFS